MKSIAHLAWIAILAGCASPKPPLPEQAYTAFAGEIAGVHKCAVKGHLTPEEASLGWQDTRARLDTYSYDSARMKHTVDTVTSTIDPSRDWCVTAAIMIASNKNQALANQGAIAADQKTVNDLLVKPRHTYCNQVGTQTFCSSY